MENIEENDVVEPMIEIKRNTTGHRASVSVPSRIRPKTSVISLDSNQRTSIGGRISTTKSTQSYQTQAKKKELDEEMIKLFFETHGVTEKDIDMAFDMLSKDKKKIYHSDIKAFIETYFGSCPDEAMILLNAWKEEVSKEQLYSFLLNKNLLSSPYETAFKWFSPSEQNTLGPRELKKFSKKLNRYKLAGKHDAKNLLFAFDMDRDGVIGLEDFKRMGL